MEKVYIFDTTLRDGEQSPGASMEIRQKVEIAKQLAMLGVDIIEAGFPITSEGDFEAVRRIAREIEGPIICGLARAKASDIDRAWEALKDASHPRIHTFINTSAIQIKHQLRKTQKEVLNIAKEMISRAKGYTNDVEFSPMDATRTDPEFLYEILETAIGLGAITLNIPDTVGYAIPEEFGNLIGSIKKNVRLIDKVVISVHCHNDLGLATANSLAAIRQGCRQVECTINGIGERAGNAALEEIIMAINTRRDLFGGFTTGIDTTQVYKTSRLVSRTTGMIVQPNKAIVGANAFAHESGIHQDGVLKEKTTYEIMTPESIGLKESRLVLGKLSGRHALKRRLEDLGFSLTDEELSTAFKRFKELADKKKEIFDTDLQALIEDEVYIPPERFKLDYFYVSCGTGVIPKAAIKIRDGDRIIQEEASGNGPVDAIYIAINKATGMACKLKDYSISALSGEGEAVGEVTVRVECEGKEATGRGISTDIIEASAKAYLSAINRGVQK